MSIIGVFGFFEHVTAYTLAVEKTDSPGVYAVMLDTEGDTLNAISGTLFFGDKIQQPPTIITGNSIVPLWIKSPSVSGNSVTFSGVLPGGFSVLYDQFGDHPRTQAKLFSLAFPYEPDVTKIPFSFDTCLAYSNNGQGTQVPITTIPSTLSIPTDPKLFAAVVDTEPPEPFAITVQSVKSFLGGRYFISFQAVDAVSGVQKYYVRENNGEWVVTSSPFIVDASKTPTMIFVKAVDGAGNERIAEAVVPGQTIPFSEDILVLYGVISLGIVIGIFIFLKKRYTIHT